MPEDFEDLLKDAYKVFATPAPLGLNVCTGCSMEPEVEQAILAKHPSEISDSELGEWFSAAYISEVFPIKIGIFLAPRLMEAAFRPAAYIEDDILFQRTPLGNSTLWNDTQNDVIRRFHDCYLEKYRKHTEVQPFLDDVLCMFSLGRFPIQNCLDSLNGWSDEDLINRIWIESCCWGEPQIWESVWWETDKPGVEKDHKTVKAWFKSPELRQRIDTYLATANPQTNTWSRAAEVEVILAKHRSTN